MSEHLTRIVASCEPRGHEKEVGRLIEAARESGADALALLGDLGDGGDVREERERLSYPGWEVEYWLKVLKETKDYQKVFLFHTPPAHKGLQERGSEVLAELVKTYAPRLVLTGGEEFRQERLGTSLVVAPGRLSGGEYALVDIHEREAERKKL